MKNLIVKIMLFASLMTGCKKKSNIDLTQYIKPSFDLEKVIVINNNESCITYFKIDIYNPNNENIVLLDNSLVEFKNNNSIPKKNGFYLKNISNDSLITLGIDNYYYYEIGGKKNAYIYLGAKNLKECFYQKDSIKLKEKLSNYVLEYNGKNLNLNEIKKSRYITQKNYNSFVNRKDSLISLKDSFKIKILSTLKFKYLNETPVEKKDWDKL